MKAAIYAIAGQRGWNWHVTLDMSIDLTYWFELLGERTTIRLLEPSISLGQAFMIQEMLNRDKGHDPNEHQMLRKVMKAAGRFAMPTSVVRAFKIRTLQVRREGFLLDPAELQRFVQIMQGRSLLLEEIIRLAEHYGLRDLAERPLSYIQRAYLLGQLQLSHGMFTEPVSRLPLLPKRVKLRCRRCGSGGEGLFFSECLFCGGSCPYCENCINMGRVRFCTPVVSSVSTARKPQPRQEDIGRFIAPWGLNDVQSEASREALRFLTESLERPGAMPRRFLIWAVTGAGKTEMLFPLISFELSRGSNVLVTTPRKDVVLELQPRLARAFPNTKIVSLYGGSEQRWERGQLTVATTHQLFRFSEAFDLVIIDEIDAFPYHNNPLLEYAACKTIAPGGAYIYLSATPPEHLQKQVRRKQMQCAKVPARFHRHPLPVPKMIATKPLESLLRQLTLPLSLLTAIQASMDRGAQLFMFVPKIHMVEPCVNLLKRLFPHIPIEGTSSKDEARGAKVQQFRDQQIRLLVTTTILERGVTIPKSDVLILGADSPIFDAAALVQMAGRAGRSKDDPAGHVYFAAHEKTAAQVKAIRQIREMNKLAYRKGYLHHL